MENTNEQQKTELLEMHLDYDGGNALQDAVRWSKFLSIVLIAGLGLLLLLFLIAGPIYAVTYGSGSAEGGTVIWVTLAILVLYLGAWVAAGIVLLRFSQLTRRGVEYRDQLVFNRGLRSLKVTFMIFAIVSCVSLAVVIITLIGNWQT